MLVDIEAEVIMLIMIVFVIVRITVNDKKNAKIGLL